MLTGYYTGVSGIAYNEQRLDVTSHNIANADTTSFRRSFIMFRTRQAPDGSRSVDRDVRDRLPPINGTERAGVYKDFDTAGTFIQTNNPYDVAIAPEIRNGFFKVRRSLEDSSTYYTRNGSLSMGHLNPSNPDSPTVLRVGSHIALDDGGQPIEIDPTQGSIHITDDGSVYQGEKQVGNLPLYQLNDRSKPSQVSQSNLQMLEQLGDSLYKIPDGYKEEFTPDRIEIGVGNVTRLVAQGVRETSNVNVVREMVEMLNTTKAVEANSRALSTHVSTVSRLLQLARNS